MLQATPHPKHALIELPPPPVPIAIFTAVSLVPLTIPFDSAASPDTAEPAAAAAFAAAYLFRTQSRFDFVGGGARRGNTIFLFKQHQNYKIIYFI